MNSNEKMKEFIIRVVYVASISALIYTSLKLFYYILPFAVGFLAAKAVDPFANKFSKRTHLPKKFSRILCMTLFIFIALLFLIIILILISNGLSKLINELPKLLEELPQTFLNMYNGILYKLQSISPELALRFADTAAGWTESAAQLPQGLLMPVLSSLYGILTGGTQLLISVGVAIVTGYLFVIDPEGAKALICGVIPSLKNESTLLAVRSSFDALKKMVAAYLKLMGITFTELLIGFVIMKIKDPLTLALLISVIDILPVLGVGTVLIPWGLILLITGSTAQSIGILVLYAAISLVRSAAEPKIVGRHIDLHPVLTLACVFLGLKAAGPAGMFALPVIVIGIIKYKEAKNEKNPCA